MPKVTQEMTERRCKLRSVPLITSEVTLRILNPPVLRVIDKFLSWGVQLMALRLNQVCGDICLSGTSF